MAILHGADPKGFDEMEQTSEKRTKSLLFGDPADYVQMGEEERKELSDKMKKRFMLWAKGR